MCRACDAFGGSPWTCTRGWRVAVSPSIEVYAAPTPESEYSTGASLITHSLFLSQSSVVLDRRGTRSCAAADPTNTPSAKRY